MGGKVSTGPRPQFPRTATGRVKSPHKKHHHDKPSDKKTHHHNHDNPKDNPKKIEKNII